MREAQHCEKLFNVRLDDQPGTVSVSITIFLVAVQEFFLTVKDLLRKQPKGVASYLKFTDREKQLLAQLVSSLPFHLPMSVCYSLD